MFKSKLVATIVALSSMAAAHAAMADQVTFNYPVVPSTGLALDNGSDGNAACRAFGFEYAVSGPATNPAKQWQATTKIDANGAQYTTSSYGTLYITCARNDRPEPPRPQGPRTIQHPIVPSTGLALDNGSDGNAACQALGFRGVVEGPVTDPAQQWQATTKIDYNGGSYTTSSFGTLYITCY